MSVRMNQDIPQGMPEVRNITFAAPSGLNIAVRGADAETGETYFRLGTINAIIRAIADLAVADAVDYKFEITRDSYVVYRMYSRQLARDLQYVPEMFPLNLRSGDYQIYMTQTSGNVTGRTLTLTFQSRLIPPG